MSFIDPDEHIIVFDMPPGALSSDDYKRLRDVGIKTVWANILWYNVEPRFGEIDWSSIDDTVSRVCGGGMKLGLTTAASGLVCAPEDWYLRMPNGDIWRGNHDGFREGGWSYSELSPWNKDAMAYERRFFEVVRARYQNEHVQLVNGGVHGGEIVLPGMVESWYDRAAIASFRSFAERLHEGDLTKFNRTEHTYFLDWDEVRPAQFPNRAAMQYHPTTTRWLHDTLLARLLDRQAFFAQQPWKETWLYTPERVGDFPETQETGPKSCNWLANEMFETFPKILGTSLNIIFFEVFRPTGTQQALWGVRGFEDRTWVGSQYVQGLYNNTHEAIARGLRGFLTAPLHFEQQERSLQPWMLDVIKWSLSQFRAARS